MTSRTDFLLSDHPPSPPDGVRADKDGQRGMEKLCKFFKNNYAISSMVKLEAPATHYLNAALGWVELGNPAEAKIELQQIAEELHRHPSVLLVKWEILAKEGKWDLAADLAQDIVQMVPDMPDGWIKRSYALHEIKRTQEAYDFLSEAGRQFPQLSIIPYNLACYACQLGHAQEAQRWLTKAMKMGDQTQIKSMALKDPDLRPLREFIEEA